MNENIFNDLKEQLKLLFPDYQLSGDGREFRINCPICLAEGRIDTGYHMYISISSTSNKPPMYNCFKNIQHRGLLTKSFLEAYSQLPQYIDTELWSEMANYTSKLSRSNRYRLNKDNKFMLYSPIPINSNRSLIKLKYINDRLGTNLILEDLPKLKIVTDLIQFINYNKIESTTRDRNTIIGLDEFFVGFLSNNNNNITFRKIPKDKLPNEYHYIDQRYIKYKTISKDVSSGYYIIPSTCDILKPIRVNIAEGPFDILSVFLNLNNANTINNIYLSIGSNAYRTAMEYLLKEYGLIDVEFHLYIDNDIPKETLPEIANIFKYNLDYRIFIHMNMMEGEKDFGVPLSRIKECIYVL